MERQALTTKELQEIELGILCHIREVCKKEQIKYYLAGGTALGAVRHKGFIPWDDDVDIVMLRSEYNRFREAMQRETESNYSLEFIDTNEKYSLPLPKVIDKRTVLSQLYQREIIPIGVYVDVFILDNAPENEKERREFVSKQVRTAELWKAAQNRGDVNNKSFSNFVKQCVRHILWLIGPRFFAIKLNKHAQKYNSTHSSLCGSFVYSTAWGKSIFPKSMFGDGKEILFENEWFMAPEKLDEYLKHDFGDYMKLPPEEDRISKHDFVAYYK